MVTEGLCNIRQRRWGGGLLQESVSLQEVGGVVSVDLELIGSTRGCESIVGAGRHGSQRRGCRFYLGCGIKSHIH